MTTGAGQRGRVKWQLEWGDNLPRSEKNTKIKLLLIGLEGILTLPKYVLVVDVNQIYKSLFRALYNYFLFLTYFVGLLNLKRAWCQSSAIEGALLHEG